MLTNVEPESLRQLTQGIEEYLSLSIEAKSYTLLRNQLYSSYPFRNDPNYLRS
jgi:hypothetical protein